MNLDTEMTQIEYVALGAAIFLVFFLLELYK
jgi:hypothetical protein